MTKHALVGLLSIAMIAVAGPVLAASPGGGGGHGGGHGHGFGRGHQGRGGNRLHTVPPRFFPNRHFHGGFGFRFNGVWPYYGYAAPYYAYAPYYGYSLLDPPAYAPPPPAYSPSVGYAPPPPAYSPPLGYTPSQTVVEFSTGRYELRGDGVTAPYRWVWVPSAPVSPPPDAMPPAPPVSAAPAEPPRRIDVYRWTDDEGVLHLTDRWDRVPEQYRAKATKSQS
jgi:hypothetical protein